MKRTKIVWGLLVEFENDDDTGDLALAFFKLNNDTFIDKTSLLETAEIKERVYLHKNNIKISNG